MNDETTNAPNPIGLYRDPESGQFVGAIDPIQADAFIQVGYKLFREGKEAAMMPQEDIDKLTPGPTRDLPEGGEVFDPTQETKGGKK